jgi:hypothetical protein
VYGPDQDKGASTSTKVEDALVNALAIVSFFLVATFVIVCCYKFNFNKVGLGEGSFYEGNMDGWLTLLVAAADADRVHDVLVGDAARHARWQHAGHCYRQDGDPRRRVHAALRHVQLLRRWRAVHLLPERHADVADTDVFGGHVGHHGVAVGAIPRVEYLGAGDRTSVL